MTKFVLFLALFVGASLASPQEELIHLLFKNYDPAITPGTPDFIGKVSFNIIPQCMELSSTGELEGNIWIFMSWNDDRLVWDPANHSGQEKIRVSMKKLWIPDIILYTKKDVKYVDEDYNVIVYSSGKIIFVPDTRVKLDCTNANFTSVWGDHECNLKYGSWTFDNEIMPLEINDDFSEDMKININCPLKIVDVEKELKTKVYSCCTEPYSNIDFKLKFRRSYLPTDKGILKNPFEH